MINKMTYDKNKYFQVGDNPKIKTSEILAKMRQKFEVYCYDEKNVDKNFPPPKKESIRYFKKVVEADEENKNKSADDLKKEGVAGITLRERLWMELDYFEETGKHLDIINITLCSGSRDSDGGVPCAYGYPDDCQLSVRGTRPDDANGSLRSRSAVSPETCNSNLPLELIINGHKYLRQ